CHVRLSDCSESSREGVVELRCYQLVSDLRVAGCDEGQTVVTHLKATPFARHASERGQGTLEGVPDNKLDGIPNALGWRLGRSNSAILPRESRDKKGQWGSRHGHLQSRRERKDGMGWWPIEYFRFAS